MARNGFDFRQFQQFADSIAQISEQQKEAFLQSCAKELAARLLAKVIRRTPVGHYPSGSGRIGGTLRRGWTAGSNQNAVSYANSLNIRHVGNLYTIDIINPVEYASYVEYGHRTRNHTGWVPGQFMLAISEEEIKQSSDAILQSKLERFMRDVINNAE